MREQKWGRVIMISSSAGKYPSAALIDYGATKSAMISISKSLAKKYGRDGVLVNSVLPGLTLQQCGKEQLVRLLSHLAVVLRK